MRSNIESLAEYIFNESFPQNCLAPERMSEADLYEVIDYWLKRHGYEFADGREIDNLRRENEGLCEDLTRKEMRIEELESEKYIVAVHIQNGALGEVYHNLPNETALVTIDKGGDPDAGVVLVGKHPAEGDIKEFLHGVIRDVVGRVEADRILEILERYDY